MTAFIRVESATWRTKDSTILSDVSLHAAKGEIVAIVGPNGAGKSTLLRIIAGDLHPTAGTAWIGDVEVPRASPRRLAEVRGVLGPAGIGPGRFSVRDVVAMGRYAGGGSADDGSIVEAAMASTDVRHLAGRRMESLSTGESQRVGLARVIAQQAPALLLDEPTSALDIGHQELVMAQLSSIAAAGVAVVVALHDLNLAAAHADRVVLLQGGEVFGVGSPWDVLVGDVLSHVYARPMGVIRHPGRGCPVVLAFD